MESKDFVFLHEKQNQRGPLSSKEPALTHPTPYGCSKIPTQPHVDNRRSLEAWDEKMAAAEKYIF